jgi:hypothetical protein
MPVYFWLSFTVALAPFAVLWWEAEGRSAWRSLRLRRQARRLDRLQREVEGQDR